MTNLTSKNSPNFPKITFLTSIYSAVSPAEKSNHPTRSIYFDTLAGSHYFIKGKELRAIKSTSPLDSTEAVTDRAFFIIKRTKTILNIIADPKYDADPQFSDVQSVLSQFDTLDTHLSTEYPASMNPHTIIRGVYQSIDELDLTYDAIRLHQLILDASALDAPLTVTFSQNYQMVQVQTEDKGATGVLMSMRA